MTYSFERIILARLAIIRHLIYCLAIFIAPKLICLHAAGSKDFRSSKTPLKETAWKNSRCSQDSNSLGSGVAAWMPIAMTALRRQ